MTYAISDFSPGMFVFNQLNSIVLSRIYSSALKLDARWVEESVIENRKLLFMVQGKGIPITFTLINFARVLNFLVV